MSKDYILIFSYRFGLTVKEAELDLALYTASLPGSSDHIYNNMPMSILLAEEKGSQES